MNTGMLWFDNDPKTTLEVKIQQAADYYRQKYGHTPDLCLVNPRVLDKNYPEPESRQMGRIHIQAFRAVLPGHIWIGVDDKSPLGAD